MIERLRTSLVRVLRLSEKYTRTDMVYLTKGGFWLLVGHAIQAVSGLVLAIAFANLIPKEVYGTYQFVMSAAVIVSAFTLTGMDAAVSRAVARGSEGALRAGFHAQLRWSVLIALAGAVLAAYYHLNGNDVLALSFLIVGACSPLLEGFGLARSYLVGKKLFRETALQGLARRILPVMLLIVTVFVTHDPVLIVLMYFVSHTVSAGFLYLLVVRHYRLPKTEETEMVAYSKHLSVLRTLSDITGQADKVLVWAFLGAAPLAAYALAQLPVTHLQGIFKLFRSLVAPKFATASFTDLKETLPRKVRIFFLITVAIAAGYILAAPFLFALIFPSYPEAVPLSQAFALALLGASGIFYSQALTAHEKKRELYTISISQNILRIALLVVLLPLYGIWGAVAAFLFHHLYINVAIRILFRYAK
ncbi:MAG: oligosaccharide flippase family protein [Patescibacteria group bacterium]